MEVGGLRVSTLRWGSLMGTIARGTPRPFFAIAFTLIGIHGCSKHSPVDPWEAVKLVRETKSQADLLTALQQLPAEVYALKLFTNCKSNSTRCEEALQILEFAYTVTEGKDSASAQVACQFKRAFALNYLFDIQSNLEEKLVGGTISDDDAASIRIRLTDIEKIKERYVNQCDRHK